MSTLVIPGRALSREPGIHPDRKNGFRVCAFGASRNDEAGNHPASERRMNMSPVPDCTALHPGFKTKKI
jgi:hypothetical protein